MLAKPQPPRFCTGRSPGILALLLSVTTASVTAGATEKEEGRCPSPRPHPTPPPWREQVHVSCFLYLVKIMRELLLSVENRRGSLKPKAWSG